MSNADCGRRGSRRPSIDWAGQQIAFESDQPLEGDDRNGLDDIYVYSVASERYTRRSEAASGRDPDGASSQAQISGDGRSVAFVSAATNIDTSFPDTNQRVDLHVSYTGAVGDPERLSLTAGAVEADQDQFRPALNYNGRLLLFDSATTNFIAGAATGTKLFQRTVPAASHALLSSGFD